MPLYEYHCPRCNAQVELLIRGGDDSAACPECGHQQMQRMLSVTAAPNVSGKGLPVASPSTAGCGRPQCGSGRCMFGE